MKLRTDKSPLNRVVSFLSKTLIFIIIPVSSNLSVPLSAAGFSSEKAAFVVKFRDEILQYRVFGIFVLPGETLTLEALDTIKENRYELQSSAGKTIPIEPNVWYWQAPQEKGLYPVKIVNSGSQDSITLNVFVMIPYEQLKGGQLDGYEIGDYPAVPLDDSAAYELPRGFVEVTKENEKTLIAPHFRLEQFLCKQSYEYPKYVVIRELLLFKLELILEEVNKGGYNAGTFKIMSGYRTPNYNRSLRSARYSRHIYGDAADIFIDEDNDDVMDDLNGDGTISYSDARVLYNVIDGMYKEPWYKRFAGGLSSYKGKSDHGPFVHVDARGVWTRW